LFVTVLPNGGLEPSRKKLNRKEMFLIHPLGSQNLCTITTLKNRWAFDRSSHLLPSQTPRMSFI